MRWSLAIWLLTLCACAEAAAAAGENSTQRSATASDSSSSHLCDANVRPRKHVLCHYGGVIDASLVDPCLCTHIVLTDWTLQPDSLQPHNLRFANLSFVGELKGKNQRLKVLLLLSGRDASSSSLAAVAADEVRTATATRHVARFVAQQRLDGVELDWDPISEERRANFTSLVRSFREALDNVTSSKHKYMLVVSVAPRYSHIRAGYDFDALAKSVDLFYLPAYNLTSRGVISHHSRLLGSDGLNGDLLLDLLLSLNVSAKQIVLGVPAFGVYYRTMNETSSSSEGEVKATVRVVGYQQICKALQNGEWISDREEDKTGPFAFKNNTWVGYDDKASVRIKSKYVLLRNLAGVGLWRLDNDDFNATCGDGTFPLVHAIRDIFDELTGADRTRVMRSLAADLDLESSGAEMIAVTSPFHGSPFRITSIVDRSGAIHMVTDPSHSDFICTRPGYYRHPADCGRFYRCVKWDQFKDDFTVFEYDCPHGLVFDEKWEVCNWPSSTAPCDGSGSSEIHPVPRNKFVCQAEGYFTDPENCRWFYKCSDLYDDGQLTAYEFRCPFDLAFDESHIMCNWRWLVPSCGESGHARPPIGPFQPGPGTSGPIPRPGHSLDGGHPTGQYPSGHHTTGGPYTPSVGPFTTSYRPGSTSYPSESYTPSGPYGTSPPYPGPSSHPSRRPSSLPGHNGNNRPGSTDVYPPGHGPNEPYPNGPDGPYHTGPDGPYHTGPDGPYHTGPDGPEGPYPNGSPGPNGPYPDGPNGPDGPFPTGPDGPDGPYGPGGPTGPHGPGGPTGPHGPGGPTGPHGPGGPTDPHGPTYSLRPFVPTRGPHGLSPTPYIPTEGPHGTFEPDPTRAREPKGPTEEYTGFPGSYRPTTPYPITTYYAAPPSHGPRRPNTIDSIPPFGYIPGHVIGNTHCHTEFNVGGHGHSHGEIEVGQPDFNGVRVPVGRPRPGHNFLPHPVVLEHDEGYETENPGRGGRYNHDRIPYFSTDNYGPNYSPPPFVVEAGNSASPLSGGTSAASSVSGHGSSSSSSSSGHGSSSASSSGDGSTSSSSSSGGVHVVDQYSIGHDAGIPNSASSSGHGSSSSSSSASGRNPHAIYSPSITNSASSSSGGSSSSASSASGGSSSSSSSASGGSSSSSSSSSGYGGASSSASASVDHAYGPHSPKATASSSASASVNQHQSNHAQINSDTGTGKVVISTSVNAHGGDSGEMKISVATHASVIDDTPYGSSPSYGGSSVGPLSTMKSIISHITNIVLGNNNDAPHHSQESDYPAGVQSLSHGHSGIFQGDRDVHAIQHSSSPSPNEDYAFGSQGPGVYNEHPQQPHADSGSTVSYFQGTGHSSEYNSEHQSHEEAGSLAFHQSSGEFIQSHEDRTVYSSTPVYPGYATIPTGHLLQQNDNALYGGSTPQSYTDGYTGPAQLPLSHFRPNGLGSHSSSGKRPKFAHAIGRGSGRGERNELPGRWAALHNATSLVGPVVCERAGLFRHPDDCTLFYACYWDKWLGRFTLHYFECPVKLAYDDTIRGCNWPLLGPPCEK